MKFSDRMLNRIRNPKDPLPLLEHWIAANPSLNPATVRRIPDFQWKPHYTKANDGLIIYFLSLFLQPWHSQIIVQKLRDDCYFQRYQGTWDKLQLMLEQVADISEFEEKYTIFWTSDEFFGNVLKRAEQLLRRNRSVIAPYERFHKPRKPQYRRGYKDKGSLRPQHERGRNLPDPNPGQDRRDKIVHPMLSRKSKIDSWRKYTYTQ